MDLNGLYVGEDEAEASQFLRLLRIGWIRFIYSVPEKDLDDRASEFGLTDIYFAELDIDFVELKEENKMVV